MAKKYSDLTEAQREERREINRACRRLKVYLAHTPEANSDARIGHQMILMSEKQNFTASVEHQANDLELSKWVIKKGRRAMLESGLMEYDQKLRAWVRTPGKTTIGRRFNECPVFHLGYRSQALRIDLAAVTEDGKAHGSYGELAKMLDANRDAVEFAIKRTDARVDIFETELFPDGRHAYRPRLELVPDIENRGRPGTRSIVHMIAEVETHKRVIRTFIEDIVPAARRLDLIDHKGQFDRALVNLYKGIKDERNAATDLSTNTKIRLGGPLDILRRYIEHLKDQGWEASINVLKMDSPAFLQFRREFRNLEGRDPINGKERVYH